MVKHVSCLRPRKHSDLNLCHLAFNKISEVGYFRCIFFFSMSALFLRNSFSLQRVRKKGQTSIFFLLFMWLSEALGGQGSKFIWFLACTPKRKLLIVQGCFFASIRELRGAPRAISPNFDSSTLIGSLTAQLAIFIWPGNLLKTYLNWGAVLAEALKKVFCVEFILTLPPQILISESKNIILQIDH